jgi:hypothetical protein
MLPSVFGLEVQCYAVSLITFGSSLMLNLCLLAK